MTNFHMAQALKKLRKDETQQAVAEKMNVSRETIKNLESGQRDFPSYITRSLMEVYDSPYLPMSIRSTYTHTGPVLFDGPNADSHRSAIREKTLEETQELLAALQAYSFAKPFGNSSDFERPRLEELVRHTAKTITCLEHLLATICEETELSYTDTWQQLYADWQKKGYLAD